MRLESAGCSYAAESAAWQQTASEGQAQLRSLPGLNRSKG